MLEAELRLRLQLHAYAGWAEPLSIAPARIRTVVRELTAADAAQALELVRARPLENVLLEYVVRHGGLGALPFLGYESRGRLAAILLTFAAGSTALEVQDSEAFEPLAEAASRLRVRPAHIVGPELVTTPFWEAYRRLGPPLVWTRREPLYVFSRLHARAAPQPDTQGGPAARIERASERELDEVVENSARQYVEDLKIDRRAEDPRGFRDRHALELRDGRWWILREGRRIAFQVHVGASNDCTVQIGGVFTPPDLRQRGHATRGVRGICEVLLERHPAVSLFCDEANRTARAVYERAGFRSVLHFRSFFAKSAASAGPRRDAAAW
jgi:predicted GNAT family acetyltransferase